MLKRLLPLSLLSALLPSAFAQVPDQVTQQTAQLKRMVPPSAFHGVHGMRFDAKGQLYAASVIGQTIYKVDIGTGPGTGKATPFIPAPDGMADDLAFAPDGTVAWTSIEDGIFHIKSPNGPVRKLMENARGVNATSFTKDGKRLFVSLVFYGDALFEVDPTGSKPPRKILENIGGLNGFDIDDDGMIYGPLWFKNKIVRINPDNGQMTTIAEGFKTPAAVKLDHKGGLYTPDAGTREVIRVDIKTGQKKVIAKLRGDLDNLALSPKGDFVYVSLSHLNAIDEVNVNTGAVRRVIDDAALVSPAGLGVVTENGKDTVWIGDVFGDVRTMNGETGAVALTPITMFQPTHLSTNQSPSAKHVTIVSNVGGIVDVFDRSTNQKVAEWKGFKFPGDAIEAADGSVIVADTGNNALVRMTGTGTAAQGGDNRSPGNVSAKKDEKAAPDPNRKMIATLQAPNGLAWAGPDAVYVSETAAGQVSRVDLKTGAKTVVASKLNRPEGMAVTPKGALLVVEVGAKSVSRIDPKTGAKTVIATNLPVGWSNGPSLFRGIASSATAIYVASDVENSIYKITMK
jgi:sugar lactone lactonase YvrE